MSIEALAKALESAIGDNDEQQEVTNWLDTGYGPLNEIISGKVDGGIPFGRIVEIYGPSSSGKTVLATLMMIHAQKMGGVAMFLDHEGTFEVGKAEKMGLKTSFPFWIYKRPDTWEQSNTLAMKAAELIRKSKAIPDSAPICCVFDSVASMIPKSVFEKGIDELTMNDTTALARVTSTTLKSVNQFTGKMNATMVYLNQIRTKPGVVYGDPTTTPGGGAMEFYASVRLALGRKRIMEEVAGEKVMSGQIITVKTQKNKLNRPFQEVEMRLVFDEDGGMRFDFTTSLIDALIASGKLAYTKPRVTWIDGKQYFIKALAKHIDETGQQEELRKLMSA